MDLKYVPVTYWLLGILFVIFIAQMVADTTSPFLIQTPVGKFYTNAIDYNFALWPGRFLQGEAMWGVVTSMFLHANIIHFFFNGFALYMFGRFLEQRIGGRNLLKLFFVAGIAGSFVHIAFSMLTGWAYHIPALGASGAIFGIFGVLIILRPDIKVVTFPIPILMPLWQAVVMFTLFGIVFMPFIAHDVHLTGLAVGLLFGRRFKEKIRKDPDHEFKIVYSIPKDAGVFENKDPYEWIDEYR
jgi:membrane associated rhomboid family serine protease